MPFPIEIKYIEETEVKLEIKFPEKFKKRMMLNNGGELDSNEYFFELYPFFDRSNKKRISRTCNDIQKEIKRSKEWYGFPEVAIVIGTDGSGNKLVLIHDENRILKEELFTWNHETGKIHSVAINIEEIEMKN